MKRIASRDNPFYKSLRRLVDGRDADVAVLEGVHLCDAFVASGGVPRDVVVSDTALDDAAVIDVVDRAGAAPRSVLDVALFASLSHLASGAGLLMVIERPRPTAPPRIDGTVVLLDRVQDPGNVGSILRSAAAAGVGAVYLSPGCAAAWSPKVIRAAMGAHFALRVHEDRALATLVYDDAVVRVATSPHAPRSLYALDLTGPVAWFFGHEGQGVDPGLTVDATIVRIPQPGSMESLNVAASAAVCLFEQVRQRG